MKLYGVILISLWLLCVTIWVVSGILSFWNIEAVRVLGASTFLIIVLTFIIKAVHDPF